LGTGERHGMGHLAWHSVGGDWGLGISMLVVFLLVSLVSLFFAVSGLASFRLRCLYVLCHGWSVESIAWCFCGFCLQVLSEDFFSSQNIYL
jgi:hypothetical protein